MCLKRTLSRFASDIKLYSNNRYGRYMILQRLFEYLIWTYLAIYSTKSWFFTSVREIQFTDSNVSGFDEIRFKTSPVYSVEDQNVKLRSATILRARLYLIYIFIRSTSFKLIYKSTYITNSIFKLI